MTIRVQTPAKAPKATSFTRAARGSLRQRRLALDNRPDHSAPARLPMGWGHDFGQVPVHYTAPASIQTKLTISQPGDKFEQEADRVADEMMRMPEPAQPAQANAFDSASNTSIQRRCAECEEEAKLQRQPVEEEEEEEVLQTKATGEAQAGRDRRTAGEAPAVVNDVLRSRGQPLKPSTRQFMESRFGHDFSRVRVHSDSRAAASASAVAARAYTVGPQIVFGAGEYAHQTARGRKLIAHELTHVLQQESFETSPHSSSTDQLDSTAVSPTPSEPWIQRARLPCTSQKTIDVTPINLPGSTRSIFNDLANANSILCQCGIEINVKGGESWDTNLLDQLSPTGVLNAPSGTTRTLTSEESTMLAHKPQGTGVIYAYYVPSFSGPKLAEAFWPSQHGERAIAVSNGALPVVMPHELAHVLLDDGGHHSNPDNLLAAGSVNTGAGELEQSQCDKM